MVEDEGSIFISVKNYYYRVNNYRIYFYLSFNFRKKESTSLIINEIYSSFSV